MNSGFCQEGIFFLHSGLCAGQRRAIIYYLDVFPQQSRKAKLKITEKKNKFLSNKIDEKIDLLMF